MPYLHTARSVADEYWGAFVGWFNRRELSENAVLLAFAVATGVASALAVVAFYKSIDAAFALFYRWPAEYLQHVSFIAYRPIVTAAGLWLAWWIMQRLGRAYEGMNVPDVQLAVVRRGGDLPARPALARTAASAITIGCGGSAGSEGPVVVLGAAVGSWLGRTFRFAPGRVKVLVACASGAAISAAFNAPLAGAFFALEEIVGTLSGASFPPVVVASVMAAVVSRGFLGNHPAFPIPTQYGYARIGELLFAYPLLGVVTGLMSALYVRSYFAAGAVERKLDLPKFVIPLLGGALVGMLVFISNGRIVGFGHLAVQLDVFGRMAWYTLLALAIGKIVATALTLNFGGSGGVFTPSLFIGAATGGAVGVAFAQIFPHAGLHPEAYALVGMGALVAGATNAPITGILLVFEMTNDYGIVLPLMLAVVICNVVARRVDRDSLYSGWLRRRGESIERGADNDVLAGMLVRDVYERRPHVIPEAAPVHQLLGFMGRGEQAYFPVVDRAGNVAGVITMMDLGQVAAEGDAVDTLVLAADLMRPSETVALDDSLLDAIRKMGVRGAAAIPVTDRGSMRLVGLVSRSHVLNAYELAVAKAGSAAQRSEHEA
jgi:CIC family chloride channel protein